ncbi:MAG: TetR/AcrR family transcriptional regulator [bacterium]|nr:TetR/AcrR family transcriptional regulator [bacterium]
MSPRSKEQNNKVRSQSINNILDASLELFAVQGYDATSISMIAEKAGISKGLLYNYFKGKEDLLRGLIDRLNSSEADMMKDVIGNDPGQTLENVLRVFFKELRDNFQQWVFVSKLALQVDKFDFVKDLAIEKYKGYTQLLEQLLTALGEPNAKQEARLLAVMFDGIGFQYMMIKEDYPLDEIENYLINKYCIK